MIDPIPIYRLWLNYWQIDTQCLPLCDEEDDLSVRGLQISVFRTRGK